MRHRLGDIFAICGAILRFNLSYALGQIPGVCACSVS
jgi:hypothetical protein